ncbi:RING finger protein 207-like [Gigantopelta aegis]|uniref:RING finger protein 207-like n=1 Tax=Gigantopelta aegis TaxID=1735272 RepID=UPI001B888142|nr:RING finger protein 207-like [Gigantopelta aegis]XP_041377187.1 RING finger protein 207-like [Gigantopelta aegis]
MSGEIFQPMETLEDLDLSKRNPLLCYLCNEQYDDPCILGCFHSYCSRCLRGRASDGKMACPLCSSMTVLKEGLSLPPSDRLLKFMVESSLDEKAQCANCDRDCGHMFFCNTCSQPLCLTCRDETHSAKMFAAHDVVLLSKRTKDIHKQCSLHGEPYIMFSAEKKIMLCINCFRDMRIESRAHCVDLETAYNQSCRKLEQSVQTIRDLQNSTREGILLLKALLDEIHVNSEKEREAILQLYDSMQEKITECKQSLLEEVDNQYKAKQSLFKAQLTDLMSLLPTIHVHLVTAAAFSSSANKFEFLDMSYAMMERLKSIVHRQHPLHPFHSSQINTDFKGQFAKSLDQLLFHGRLSAAISSNSSMQRNGNGVTPPPSISRLDLSKSGNPGFKMSPNNSRRASGSATKIKFIDAKGVFAEHCVEFETSHREMLQRLEKLKSDVQELQRDLTLRRCLTRKSAIPNLKELISTIEQQLEVHRDTIEQKQPALEKHWEESVQRMTNENELYQAQINDVHRLQQETQHLKLIASQLSSFVDTISLVTERLAPKVGQIAGNMEHDNQMQSLMEEINAVQPDSQQRVDAIQTVEVVREEKSANRKNPLDEELIKTKGLLKATPVRKDGSLLSKQDNSVESQPKATDELQNKDDSFHCSKGDNPSVNDSEPSAKRNSFTSAIISTELAKQENTSVPLLDTDKTGGILENLPPPSNSILKLSNNEGGDMSRKTDMEESSSKQEEENLGVQNSGHTIPKTKTDCIQVTKKGKLVCLSGKESDRQTNKDSVLVINGASGDENSEIFISPVIKNGLVVSKKDGVKNGDCLELTECSVEATVVLSVKS